MTQHQPKHRSWFKVSLLAGAVLVGGVLSIVSFLIAAVLLVTIFFGPLVSANEDQVATAIATDSPAPFTTSSPAQPLTGNWLHAGVYSEPAGTPAPEATDTPAPAPFITLAVIRKGQPCMDTLSHLQWEFQALVQTTAMRPNKFFRRMAPYFKSAIAFGFTLPTTSRLTSWFMDKH